jgi:HAD superfamily hydrolase (TIGR01509 family)
MASPLVVLFDFDGVIADTANLHIAAWERVIQQIGLEVDAEACLEAAEIDDRQFLIKLLASKGIDASDADIAGWVGRKLDLTLKMLRDEPRVYPGLVELLQRLTGRVRLGIVSTAWRPVIEAVLESAAVESYFETIVAKEDVTRPKPDPEPYRLAVSRFGLKPEQLVAIEDSPTGLASAHAAGLRAVAIGHRRLAGDWCSVASSFLPDLTDLPAVGRALGVDL